MVRKRRVWVSGGKYHITSRGIRKYPIFLDDFDRVKYLTLLEETMSACPFILHAYCLMTNHVHLQLESSSIPPNVIISQLHTKYAKYFNKKYDYSGHVFEKRYNAELIDSPAYELDVSKYIHLNPCKAGIVDEPEDYPWSSYRNYLYGEASSLVFTNQILSYFPHPQAIHYENFVKSPFYIFQSAEKAWDEEYPCGPK